jgi:peptide-methionine (S)-S-oxide reductase
VSFFDLYFDAYLGTQYASVIFCYSEEQLEVAKRVKGELQQLLNSGSLTCFNGTDVTTHICLAKEFYAAKSDHQDYLSKNPNGYCNHRIQWTTEWPSSDQ